jgi:hypothetical protein
MMTGKQIFEKLGYTSTNIKSIDARLFVDPKRDTATAYLGINENFDELVIGFKDVFKGDHECHSVTVKSKDTKQFISGVECIIWHPVDDIHDWQFQFNTTDGLEKIVFHMTPTISSLDNFLTNEKKGGLVAEGSWEKTPESLPFNQWLTPSKANVNTPKIQNLLESIRNGKST